MSAICRRAGIARAEVAADVPDDVLDAGGLTGSAGDGAAAAVPPSAGSIFISFISLRCWGLADMALPVGLQLLPLLVQPGLQRLLVLALRGHPLKAVGELVDPAVCLPEDQKHDTE